MGGDIEDCYRAKRGGYYDFLLLLECAEGFTHTHTRSEKDEPQGPNFTRGFPNSGVVPLRGLRNKDCRSYG